MVGSAEFGDEAIQLEHNVVVARDLNVGEFVGGVVDAAGVEGAGGTGAGEEEVSFHEEETEGADGGGDTIGQCTVMEFAFGGGRGCVSMAGILHDSAIFF